MSASAYASSTSTVSVAQIKRQIATLQKKIQAEQASNDDAQTKAAKLQLYQTQLTQLQLQLQQLQQASAAS